MRRITILNVTIFHASTFMIITRIMYAIIPVICIKYKRPNVYKKLETDRIMSVCQ